MRTRPCLRYLFQTSVAGFLLLALANAAFPGEPRRLTFHRGSGDKAFYDFAVSGRGIQEDRPVEFTLKMRCEVVFGKQSHSSQEVQASIVAGTVEAKSGGEQVSRKLSPYSLIYQIAANGQTLSSRVAAGKPPEIPFAQMTFSPEDAAFLLHLSAGPVKKGDTWNCDSGPASPQQRGKTTFTVLGEETFKGRPCLKIGSASRLKVDETAPAGSQIQAHLQGQVISGQTYLFDYGRGLVLFAEGSDKFSLTSSVEDPETGQSTVKRFLFAMNKRSTLTQLRPRGG
jgi:hypothetical protein